MVSQTQRNGLWFAALLAGYLLIYILPLGGRLLAIPDETRYAEIPREMLASGDYVVPRLNGLRYFEKPPLGYWCHALCLSAFGHNSFAVRLPSPLAAGGTALLLLLLLRRFGPDPLNGVFAAGAYLLCVEVFALGIFAVLDSLFTLFVTGTLASFFCAYRSRGRRRTAWLSAMGLFCGAAFLTKGFLALGLPAVVIAPFLLWERRWRLLFTLPWTPLAVAAVIILPWTIAIHVRESDFWHHFIWVEHLRRFAGENAQHHEPFWYLLPVLLGGALPWTPLFPAAVVGLRSVRGEKSLLRFALCWSAVPFLLFSLSAGKLGTYILPCFPPLMILVTVGLTAYLKRGHRLALIAGASVIFGLVACAAVGLFLLPVDGLGLVFTGSVAARRCTLAVSLVTWGVLVALAVRTQRPSHALALFCAGPALLLLTVHLAVGGVDRPGRTPVPCLESRAREVPPNARIVSSVTLAPAICWVLHRADIHILSPAMGEMAYGLGFPDSKQWRIGFQGVRTLAADPARSRPVVLILHENPYLRWRMWLPAPDKVEITDGLVFAFY